LNPAALVRGQIVEDEGAYGIAHVALGNNTKFVGGTNWAPIHFDYVFLKPMITLDGRALMPEGRLDLNSLAAAYYGECCSCIAGHKRGIAVLQFDPESLEVEG